MVIIVRVTAKLASAIARGMTRPSMGGSAMDRRTFRVSAGAGAAGSALGVRSMASSRAGGYQTPCIGKWHASIPKNPPRLDGDGFTGLTWPDPDGANLQGMVGDLTSSKYLVQRGGVQ
jgi:hypothetical protein